MAKSNLLKIYNDWKTTRNQLRIEKEKADMINMLVFLKTIRDLTDVSIKIIERRIK